MGLSHKAWLLMLCAGLTACATQSQLKPFKSDGCSLFPDQSLISKTSWRSCCVSHDLAYWRGGTQVQRHTADAQLRHCVLENTGNHTLAQLMYNGVRVGGSPYFPTWYRWGYGWSYGRHYQPLTPAEAAEADQLQQQYEGAQ